MIASILKRLIPEKSKRILKEKLGVPSQEASFKNIRKLGFSPKSCLDIGAYEGFWTHDFKRIFPDCSVMMFEGQVLKEPALRNIKKEYKDVDYKIALLGANKTNVSFNIYETASSVLAEHNDTNAKIETRTLVTLDEQLKTSGFEKPDLIHRATNWRY
jgi:FkbM family methyltransferase